MSTTEPQGRYSAYLLRLWQTGSGGDLAYRASIEDAHSNERVVFGSLDELCDYLRARAGGGHETVRDAAVYHPDQADADGDGRSA